MSNEVVGYDARSILRGGFETRPAGAGTGAPVVLEPPRLLFDRHRRPLYHLDPAVRAAANAERAATLGQTADAPRRATCRCCGKPARGWWRDFKLCRACGRKGYAAWKGVAS